MHDNFGVGPAPIGRSERSAGLWAFVVFAVVGSLIVTYWIVSDSRRRSPAAIAATVPSAPTPTVGHHYAPITAGPDDLAMEVLRLHAVALIEGDEAGWLAAVDPAKPALVARYRGVYRSLRTLGVDRYSYRRNVGTGDRKNPSVRTIPVRASYCFGADTCADRSWGSVGQILTMRPVGGKYVITAMADQPGKNNEPVAWQAGTLQFVQGKRTIVGAEPTEAKYLSQYLAIAEQAAAADDPFAVLFLTRQTRYRVFLAGEKQWKKWYGGSEDWAVGTANATSESGYDVVLRVARLDTARERLVTMKHELGHVITLTGAANYRDRDRWLREGIAEYIGWAPKTAQDSFRRPSAEWGAHRFTTMVQTWPGYRASDRAGDAFYALSHYAIDCLAQTYGRERMLRFARLILLHDEPYDAAARDAFKKPFAAVDKSCVAWVRQHV